MKFIPAAFQQNALGPIRQEYKKNLARIRAAKIDAKKAPASVDDTDSTSNDDSKAEDAIGAVAPSSSGSGDSSSGGGGSSSSSSSAENSGSSSESDDSAPDSSSASGSIASADVAGQASVTDLAAVHVPTQGSALSGKSRLRLAGCAGLALSASMVFVSRVIRSPSRAEELESPIHGHTPFLLLDQIA